MLSAGVVVLHPGPRGYRLLLLRAYRHWDFPKGLVEPGEEPFEAACREVREETGLTGLRFTWGQAYVETAPYGRGKVARYYVAETPEDRVVLGVSPVLGRPEHDEFRWVTLEQARGLLVPRVAEVLDWAATLAGLKGTHE